MAEKSIHEINERIRGGSARVVTADRMSEIVDELGPEGAVKEVDVVTTGTFGAMSSSGVLLNFGHSDPPIKMQSVWLNDVECYTGIAAVDAYLGSTQLSETKKVGYGGAHVIEDFVSGKKVDLRSIAYGTDCYPRRSINTEISIDDLNQATMLNPRNAYQRYNVATNSSDKTIYTYMGTLLPRNGNATYSGAGDLSPLSNDPTYETIGMGTRIFLCGAEGYVIGEGTQHSPGTNFGTIMVRGDLKKMNVEFLRAAIFHRYGPELYIGIGIPIPILNERLALSTAIKDSDISTSVLDYSIPRRSRPTLKTVTYADLKSGAIEIDGREVKTSPISSYYVARKIADTLKSWIERGEFTLTLPVERLAQDTPVRPMKQTRELPHVKDVMLTNVTTIKQGSKIEEAAKKIIEGEFTHLPVVSEDDRLVGIVTAWDISKAVASKNGTLDEIMTKKVITSDIDEPVEISATKVEKHNISALPVIDKERRVVGILTSDDITKLVAERRVIK
ncbi:MAG: homocysteine biosynthesis protein [Halobacteriota archaeon]|nr:homocysteine biosynthesis protein [Halobacteriota archaeon]